MLLLLLLLLLEDASTLVFLVFHPGKSSFFELFLFCNSGLLSKANALFLLPLLFSSALAGYSVPFSSFGFPLSTTREALDSSSLFPHLPFEGSFILTLVFDGLKANFLDKASILLHFCEFVASAKAAAQGEGRLGAV